MVESVHAVSLKLLVGVSQLLDLLGVAADFFAVPLLVVVHNLRVVLLELFDLLTLVPALSLQLANLLRHLLLVACRLQGLAHAEGDR